MRLSGAKDKGPILGLKCPLGLFFDLCNQACSDSMSGPRSKGPRPDTRCPGLHDLIAQIVFFPTVASLPQGQRGGNSIPGTWKTNS